MNDQPTSSGKGYIVIYLLTAVAIVAVYIYFMRKLVGQSPNTSEVVAFPTREEGVVPGEPPRANGASASAMSPEPGKPPRAAG